MLATNKKTFFALITAFIVLTSLVYALQESNGNIVLGIWYNSDSTATSATITNGNNIGFNVYALAVGSTLTIDVDLIKQDGNVVHIQHFSRGYMNYNEFGIGDEGDYTINRDVYGIPGNHKIRLTDHFLQLFPVKSHELLARIKHRFYAKFMTFF